MKNCLECGEKIVGREDKKFCNDGCRNAFNNRLNKDANNYRRTIHNLLRKNYRILCELNPKGKSKTTKARLHYYGFDFTLLTELRTTEKGNIYYFVYDQGYRPTENEGYMLVKKEM